MYLFNSTLRRRKRLFSRVGSLVGEPRGEQSMAAAYVHKALFLSLESPVIEPIYLRIVDKETLEPRLRS